MLGFLVSDIHWYWKSESAILSLSSMPIRKAKRGFVNRSGRRATVIGLEVFAGDAEVVTQPSKLK